MKKRAYISVSGRVQGVGFRYSIQREAKKLNITGFARNVSNGDVEIIAEGEEENLKQLIDFCKKGPLIARVDNVNHEFSDYKGEFNNFRTR
jgi:acylphosphatase